MWWGVLRYDIISSHMKELKITTLIVTLVLVASLAAGTYFKRSAYVVDLHLTPQEKADYEGKVAMWDKKIHEVKPPDLPDIDFFIEKSRYQEYQGKYGEAIDTLLNAMQYYSNTSAGWNNIAKLYDKIGDYESAAIFYSKLISVFRLNHYYLELAWDNYRMGKIPGAREAYGRYAQLAGGNDEDLFKLLFKSQ